MNKLVIYVTYYVIAEISQLLYIENPTKKKACSARWGTKKIKLCQQSYKRFWNLNLGHHNQRSLKDESTGYSTHLVR